MIVPVLRLPHVAFENVYDYFEIPDVIMLSQCSKRMKTIVKSIEKRQGKCLEVLVSKRNLIVRVTNSEKECLFDWRVCLENRQNLNEENVINRNIEGQKWKTAQGHDNTSWIVVPRAGSLNEDLLTIVQFFQDVFQCSIDKIHFRLFNELSFDKLLRGSTLLHTARGIFIERTNFSPAEIDFMFDNFNAELLKFGGHSNGLYSYQKPVLRFPKIQIDFAQWITAAYFMEMAETCKKIRLCNASQITDQALNMFIKAWLAGTNKTLESVEIHRKSVFERDAILNDVEHTVLKIEAPKARIEVEIERTDGKLARVIVGPFFFVLCPVPE